jgi:hypothetical protein
VWEETLHDFVVMHDRQRHQLGETIRDLVRLGVEQAHTEARHYEGGRACRVTDRGQ